MGPLGKGHGAEQGRKRRQAPHEWGFLPASPSPSSPMPTPMSASVSRQSLTLVCRPLPEATAVDCTDVLLQSLPIRFFFRVRHASQRLTASLTGAVQDAVKPGGEEPSELPSSEGLAAPFLLPLTMNGIRALV